MKTLIYEMNVSTWVNANEMIKHLDRVKELGAKYVCLSGLCSETDYEKVAEPFDDDSFANFMKKARELKLEVLMNLNLDSTATTNVWHADEGLYSYTDGSRAYLKWWNEGDKNEENKNPVIAKMFHDLVIFWGDRGICGFKVHVPHPNGQLDNIAGKAEAILLSVFSTVNVRVIIEVDKFQDSERFSYLADWILDSSLSKNTENFISEAKKFNESYLFMLSTETSASKKRFPEVQDCTPESARWMLFHTGVKLCGCIRDRNWGSRMIPKTLFRYRTMNFRSAMRIHSLMRSKGSAICGSIPKKSPALIAGIFHSPIFRTNNR